MKASKRIKDLDIEFMVSGFEETNVTKLSYFLGYNKSLFPEFFVFLFSSSIFILQKTVICPILISIAFSTLVCIYNAYQPVQASVHIVGLVSLLFGEK